MAKFKKADYKKQHNLYSVMGKIGDIIFYPVIIITLICCFAIYTSKSNNEVPTVLGVSMVSVLTGSMVAAGFDIDEMVFLHQTNSNALRAGDIIAFYEVGSDPKTRVGELRTVQTYSMETKEKSEFNKAIFDAYKGNDRVDVKDIKSTSGKSARILFHRIIEVKIGEDGTVYYITQGDSNLTPDSCGMISEDAVVGKYMFTPKFVRGAFQFVSTPTGMIVMVVAPLCLLCLFMLFSIIEQLSKMGLEKKVLARLVPYNDPEVLKANIGIEMEVFDKARFYATADKKERNDVSYFLWGYLDGNKETQETHSKIMDNLTNLDKDSQKYWLFFIGQAKKGYQKKMLNRAWQQWKVEEQIKQKSIYMKKKNQTEQAEKEPTKTKAQNSKSQTVKKTVLPELPKPVAKKPSGSGKTVLPEVKDDTNNKKKR